MNPGLHTQVRPLLDAHGVIATLVHDDHGRVVEVRPHSHSPLEVDALLKRHGIFLPIPIQPQRPMPRAYRHPNRHFEPSALLNPGWGERMPPKPTSRLPAEAKKTWDRVYRVAKEYYVQERAPEPEMLSRTCAWKAVRLGYERKFAGRWEPLCSPGKVAGHWPDGKQIKFGEKRALPRAAGVGILGKLLELTFLSPDGRFMVQRFEEPGLPDLCWNDGLKACLSFPLLDIPNFCTPIDMISEDGYRRSNRSGFDMQGLQEGIEVVERWHQREADCFFRVDPPKVKVQVVGLMDTIVYRSDKWGNGDEPVWQGDLPRNPHPDLEGSREYVHQDEYGVVLEESSGWPPEAIVIHGGRLDAWKEGLVY